jgi:hypothetical protein
LLDDEIVPFLPDRNGEKLHKGLKVVREAGGHQIEKPILRGSTCQLCLGVMKLVKLDHQRSLSPSSIEFITPPLGPAPSEQ